MKVNSSVIRQLIEHRLDFDRMDVPGKVICQSVDQVNEVLVLVINQRNARREIGIPGEDVKVLTIVTATIRCLILCPEFRVVIFGHMA